MEQSSFRLTKSNGSFRTIHFGLGPNTMQQQDCGFKQRVGLKPKCKYVDADYTSCNYGFRSVET